MSSTSFIPQVLVTLSPEGELTAELPGRGTRHKVPLGKLRSAGQLLMDLLLERKAEIEHQNALQLEAEAERRKAKRKAAQPDWQLIAKHPEAEIRERLGSVEVQLVPMAGGGRLTVQKARKSMEEMGL